MKNITILLLFLALLFCGCADSDSSGSSGSSGPPDDFSLKYVGRQRLEATLKDPDSLEIIEERLIRPGVNGGEVGYYAKFRARNGFGGMNVEEFYTE